MLVIAPPVKTRSPAMQSTVHSQYQHVWKCLCEHSYCLSDQELVNIGCTEHKIPLMNQNTLKQTNFRSEPTLAWSGRLHTNISQGTLWE